MAFEQEDATQLAKLETERQAIEEESMRYRRARMTELVSRVANAEALAAEYREKLNDLETSAALSHQHIVHIEASAAQLSQKIKEMETEKQLQHQKFMDSQSLLQMQCEEDWEVATVKHINEVPA